MPPAVCSLCAQNVFKKKKNHQKGGKENTDPQIAHITQTQDFFKNFRSSVCILLFKKTQAQM